MMIINLHPVHLLGTFVCLVKMSLYTWLIDCCVVRCQASSYLGTCFLLCRAMYPCASGQVSAGAQQPFYAAQGYPILNLFLLANLMTTTSTLPVLLGLLDGPIASRLFTPLSALFGCWFSFASIVVYGRIMLADWGGTMSDVSHLPSPCFAPLCCVA